MRAEAEGEFQGLVLRSNQEQSFFFQERNLRTRQWKEALLVLGLSEEPGERERDFFQDNKPKIGPSRCARFVFVILFKSL